MVAVASPVAKTSAGGRLRKAERREQLLDAAAEIILERGLQFVTMEALAERAGVSKALPYAHFDNAEDVLGELYRREVALIGQRVTSAVEGAAPGEPQVRAAVHEYFEIVGSRGRILALLATHGPRTDDPRLGHRYVGDFLTRTIGLSPDESLVAGTIAFGAIHGAIESWMHHDAGRSKLENMVVRMLLAAGPI